MIPAMILLILLLAGLIGVYYHFFLGRLFRAFSLPEKAKWVRCLLMVALTGCSLMVFSTFGLLMLHFTVFPLSRICWCICTGGSAAAPSRSGSTGSSPAGWCLWRLWHASSATATGT